MCKKVLLNYVFLRFNIPKYLLFKCQTNWHREKLKVTDIKNTIHDWKNPELKRKGKHI